MTTTTEIRLANAIEELTREITTSRQMLQAIKGMMAEVVTYMKDAESEIPEKMRRFIMYFHDVHDVMYLYENAGHVPPDHVKKEVERCSDRYRHILEELHSDTGAFEKVRQEMSKRAGNRYDYSRQLMQPLKEKAT